MSPPCVHFLLVLVKFHLWAKWCYFFKSILALSHRPASLNGNFNGSFTTVTYPTATVKSHRKHQYCNLHLFEALLVSFNSLLYFNRQTIFIFLESCPKIVIYHYLAYIMVGYQCIANQRDVPHSLCHL